MQKLKDIPSTLSCRTPEGTASADPTFMSSGGSFLLSTLSRLERPQRTRSIVHLFNLDHLTERLETQHAEFVIRTR